MVSKIIITLTLFFSVANAGTITLAGACACNSTMADAFSEIDTHIVDDNLKEIDKSLDNQIPALETKLEKLEKEIETLDKFIKQAKEEVTYLKKVAFLTEQETQIRAKHKLTNPVEYIIDSLHTPYINKYFNNKDIE